jgi:hypothetical protein
MKHKKIATSSLRLKASISVTVELHSKACCDLQVHSNEVGFRGCVERLLFTKRLQSLVLCYDQTC